MIMDAWAGMDNRVSYKKGVPPEMERRIEKYARIGRRLDKLIRKRLMIQKPYKGMESPENMC